MDNALGVLVLMGVILFPVVWWFLNDRAEPETHDYPQTPPEATRDIPYGEPQRDYGGVPPRQYAEQRTEQAYAPTPWEPRPNDTGIGAPVWTEAKSLEEEAPLERDYAEEHLLEDEQVTRASVHSDSLMEGGPRSETPSRAAPALARRRRSPRSAIIAQLHNRRGLRQAILFQAVIGQPKALQEDDESFASR